jgi:5-methylcytosine-specific restriction endonuclease McrA
MVYGCKKCGSGQIKIDRTYPYHDIYECVDCNHSGHTRIEECCRKPLLVVAIVRNDHGRYALYRQCLNCGGAIKTKPLKSKDYGGQIRGDFNQDRFEEWKFEKSTESNVIYESLRRANYKNTNAYKYHTYLQSEEWNAKRTLVLNRDNNLCQLCKTEPALDVHHLTYDNLYNEPLEDLQALCRACHVNIHSTALEKIQSTV